MAQVYNEVRKTFTPVKQSHYVFTPRDLTRWIIGLMRYSINQFIENSGGDGVGNEVQYAWCFESCRIFRDKLVSQEEKDRFTNAILLPVAGQWGITYIDEVKQGTKILNKYINEMI